MTTLGGRVSRFLAGAGGVLVLGFGAVVAAPAAVSGYKAMYLAADASGLGPHKIDPSLINPWGLLFSNDGLLVAADNGSGRTTHYRATGRLVPPVIDLPVPAGDVSPATPTGVVINHTNAFLIAVNGKSRPSRFIFAAENGTIIGYNEQVDRTHGIMVANVADAVYKGLARGRNLTNVFLYAANFSAGTVDVFDSQFAPTTMAGPFIDPDIPAGFAPFGIRLISGQIYVTYAKQDVNRHDDVPGTGNGYVSIFDADGRFLRRLTSQGVLNSPWGLAKAPSRFGRFSNAILVGNFGDGHLNAFDQATGDFLGQLATPKGTPIVIEGLWGLAFRRPQASDSPRLDDTEDDHLLNLLYFTAGPAHQTHGLLGVIHPVPSSGKPPK